MQEAASCLGISGSAQRHQPRPEHAQTTLGVHRGHNQLKYMLDLLWLSDLLRQAGTNSSRKGNCSSCISPDGCCYCAGSSCLRAESCTTAAATTADASLVPNNYLLSGFPQVRLFTGGELLHLISVVGDLRFPNNCHQVRQLPACKTPCKQCVTLLPAEILQI